jgi:hypothetical protein
MAVAAQNRPPRSHFPTSGAAGVCRFPAQLPQQRRIAPNCSLTNLTWPLELRTSLFPGRRLLVGMPCTEHHGVFEGPPNDL